MSPASLIAWLAKANLKSSYARTTASESSLIGVGIGNQLSLQDRLWPANPLSSGDESGPPGWVANSFADRFGFRPRSDNPAMLSTSCRLLDINISVESVGNSFKDGERLRE